MLAYLKRQCNDHFAWERKQQVLKILHLLSKILFKISSGAIFFINLQVYIGLLCLFVFIFLNKNFTLSFKKQ